MNEPTPHDPDANLRWSELARPQQAMLVVAVALIAATFVLNVGRYWFVGDDAYISFRYAQNFADGLGLVWNPGEYVEGYTNFLWVLILAIGMKLGVEPEGLSCVLGVIFGAGVLFMLGVFSARRIGLANPLVLLPLFALALSRSFTAWSTSGLATMFFTWLVLAAQVRLIREVEEDARPVWGSSLLFAAATLTRPEGGLFTFAAGLLLLGFVQRGRLPFTQLVRWCAPWFAIVGAHFVWRFFYYGAWLPNTFHAKVNGFWPSQGWRYFATFQEDYQLAFFLPLIGLALWKKAGFAHALLALSSLVYAAYLLSIGGGRFEFRFLVVILPAVYWLVAEGIDCIRRAERLPAALRPTAVAALALALLATTHHGSTRPEATLDRHHIESVQRTKQYADHRARQGKTLRGYIDAGLLPADLQFSAGGAGALPYYTRWPTLDFRGLNDPLIARTPLAQRGVIAHEHNATPAYLRERGVVVYDSMNQLIFHDDPLQYRGKSTLRADHKWKLRAVRVGDDVMVFSSLVPEREFRRVFRDLEILY